MLVAEGIHRRTNDVVSSYVVEEGGRLTVVDAGAPGDWDLLARHVASIGRSFADLDTVVLTHAHSDHTGFAERARAEAGAKVRVHADDAERATKGTTPKNMSGYGVHLLRLGAYRTTFVLMRTKGLKIVPIAMRSLRALEPIRAEVPLPGHGDTWTGGVAEAVRLARAAGRS